MQKSILTFGTLLLCTLLNGIPLASAAEIRQKWPQDYEEACERNSLQECLNLAVAYSRGEYAGKKVEKNPILAKNYIDRSIQLGTHGCQQGNLKFCYTLALLYFEGGLISTDFPKAIDYGNKACSGGLKEACEWLRNSGL